MQKLKIIFILLTAISFAFFTSIQLPIYIALAASSTSLPPSKTTGDAIPDSFKNFVAKHPIHNLFAASTSPQGLVPSEIKSAYHLPTSGGAGTIAIISAFDHPYIESDLAVFDKTFSILPCTSANKCLEVHKMSSKEKTNTGWSLESALDTEWAHAIAPTSKILVVEAASDSGTDLINAVDYAHTVSGVVSISMSWGGDEFAGETSLDSHFASSSKNISYFASSGDDGTGASWPAVSPNVIAVGGTSLAIDTNGKFFSENAWSGSGGGISRYENEPTFQKDYSIYRANGKRAIPDVSYAADPIRGFSIYHVDSTTIAKTAPKIRGWYVVGGTSAGAPQWAAIATLGWSIKDLISLPQLYSDKAASNANDFFRDITSGANGTCAYYCSARKHYDYVTGLGSPLTYKF